MHHSHQVLVLQVCRKYIESETGNFDSIIVQAQAPVVFKNPWAIEKYLKRKKCQFGPGSIVNINSFSLVNKNLHHCIIS